MNALKKIITIFLLFNFFTIGSASSKELENIAVLDFNNETTSSGLNKYKSQLAESFRNNLAKYPNLKIVEKSKVDAVLKDLNLDNQEYIDPVSAVKLGKALSLKYVILGSLDKKSGNLYYIGIRLFDIESSKIIMKRSVISKNREGVLKSTNYLSLIMADNLGESIDKNELKNSEKEIEAYKQNNTIQSVILIGISAVVVAGITFLAVGLNSLARAG